MLRLQANLHLSPYISHQVVQNYTFNIFANLEDLKISAKEAAKDKYKPFIDEENLEALTQCHDELEAAKRQYFVEESNGDTLTIPNVELFDCEEEELDWLREIELKVGVIEIQVVNVKHWNELFSHLFLDLEANVREHGEDSRKYFERMLEPVNETLYVVDEREDFDRFMLAYLKAKKLAEDNLDIGFLGSVARATYVKKVFLDKPFRNKGEDLARNSLALVLSAIAESSFVGLFPFPVEDFREEKYKDEFEDEEGNRVSLPDGHVTKSMYALQQYWSKLGFDYYSQEDNLLYQPFWEAPDWVYQNVMGI